MRQPTLVLAIVAALLVGCSGSDTPDIGVPTPSLSGAERLVAERIRDAIGEVSKNPESATAWGRLGAIYDVNGFRGESVPCYERAQELAPGEWRWSYFAGLALRDDDRSAARARLERAARLQSGYPPLEFYLGELAVRDGELQEARSRFEAALAADPRLVNAMLGLARIAVKTGNAEAALVILDRALMVAPGDGAVYSHRAEVLRALGRPEDAAAAAELARSSPVRPRRDGYTELNDPVRDAVTLAEGVTAAWLLENAQRHLDAGRASQGLAAVRRAVDADPDSIEVRLEASRMLTRAGELEQAVAEAERALVLDGSRAESYAQLGETLSFLGQRERAEEALRQALRIDGQYHEARGSLGMLLVDTGRVDEGLALLREASDGRPGNPDLGHNLAAALIKAGSLDEARQVVNLLIENRPTYVHAHVLLGTIHAMAGRPEPSVESFRRALELDPNDVETRMELGRSLWELGRYAEAIQTFADSAAGRPSDPEIARELASALATSPDEGARDGARALAMALRLCEATFYRDPTYLETLAAAQAATGRFDDADETVGRALTIVDSALAELSASDPSGEAKRGMLQEFAEKLRARRARYARRMP